MAGDGFSELCVLVLGIVALLLARSTGYDIPPAWLICCALWHILAMFALELRVVLVDRGPLVSYQRSAILTLMNYGQMVCWFAVAEKAAHNLSVPRHAWGPLGALFFSLSAMSLLSVDPGKLCPSAACMQSSVPTTR
jgi:hypothetical protein